MDRNRRRAAGRALVGVVVLTAALYGGLAAHATGDASGSPSRHASLRQHEAALRTLLPARAADQLSKPRVRETVAITVAGFAAALLLGSHRRLRLRPLPLGVAFVRFGAPRAPPSYRLQP